MGHGTGLHTEKGKLVRDIAFDDLKDFKELFESLSEDKKIEQPDQTWNHFSVIHIDKLTGKELYRNFCTSLEISPYCCVVDNRPNARHRSFWLKPTEKTIKFIRENMLDIEGGVFFQLNIYTDGTALVSVKYNSIIGSRWLADVDLTTIPTMRTWRCKK